mmetsp:Transcript_61229/g.167968  ORF Transcript_61229/g.167968 Transcript_61229/m.167968 type:complete len:550 (+) Transcript_61229:174-1823(+)
MASFEGMASGPASFPVEGDRQSSEGAVDEAASAEIRLRWEATWPTPSKGGDVIQHGQLLKRRERGYFKNGFISRYWVLRKDAMLCEYTNVKAWLDGQRPRRTIYTAAEGTTIEWRRHGPAAQKGRTDDALEQLLAIETAERSFCFRAEGGATDLEKWAQALRSVQEVEDGVQTAERIQTPEGSGDAGSFLDIRVSAPTFEDITKGVSASMPSAPTFEDMGVSSTTLEDLYSGGGGISDLDPTQNALDFYNYVSSFDITLDADAGVPDENEDEIGLGDEVRSDTLNHLVSFAGAIEMEGYGDLRLVGPGSSSKICFDDDMKVVAGIAGRVLYDRALWEEERTREKGQQRLPLKVMDDGSDEWLVERLYRVHGSPYPYRKELHITFILREKLPGELDSLRDPSFGVTGRTLTSSGTFTFATRPLLYITPKENIKRHALSAALTMGFGREGWTQETDRDGQEVWVIQRPPFISEDPACDRDADDGAPRCGGLMFTFLLRNPGRIGIQHILTFCSKFRLRVPLIGGEQVLKFEVLPGKLVTSLQQSEDEPRGA